jgi:hypothetical protein
LTDIVDVRPEAGAIDFRFINRGGAVAVLDRFTISILDFRLDTTPLLEYSYGLAGNMSWDGELHYGTSLELIASNCGWGSALGLSATLTWPTLAGLFPQSALCFDFAWVEGGADLAVILLAEGADQAAMDRLRERRAAILEKAVTALSEVNEEILEEQDFLTLLSFHEQWHIREFFSDYPHAGNGPRQRWHSAYISELDSDYLPIRLGMHVVYGDQDGRQHSEDTVALTSFDRFMTEGELWIGPAGFRYKVHPVAVGPMSGRGAYAVILDPDNPGEWNYRVSRSIRPGDAARFHVVLASRVSGDFCLRLSFHVNDAQVVRSDPLWISLNHPRNASLPAGLSDGASFELRDGRLELGTR